MTAAYGELPPSGPCLLNVAADGSRITRLSAHVHPDTAVSATEYRPERRVVLHLGQRLTDSVDVYVRLPELARLIDVLNAAYTRLVADPDSTGRTIANGVT